MESNNFLSRLKSEIGYYSRRVWTLEEVGDFWDSVDDYDDINSNIYPYKQRFLNSKQLFENLNLQNFEPNNVLDIQCRTGKGSIFWSKIFNNMKIHACDFSKKFLEKTRKNLFDNNLNFELQLIKNFPLNFNSDFFDFVITYETLEHVCEYKTFIKELSRVLKKDGIMILTCPNISWEINHFLSTVLGVNHSEGPHKFLSLKKINAELTKNNLKVLSYNTSIFLPFNNSFSIRIDGILKKITPSFLKKIFFLRHSFIIQKI